jgi:hypothetical protein
MTAIFRVFLAASLCVFALYPRAAHAAAAAPTIAECIADLVTANHILFDQGVVDAFGHVSVRSPTRPDRFYMARNRAPGEVRATATSPNYARAWDFWKAQAEARRK